MREGSLVDLLYRCFLLQEKPPGCERKTMMMMMKMAKMRKICSSRPPGLALRRPGTLLLEEYSQSPQEVYVGRWCWATRGGERQREETPNHSQRRQTGEGGREETQPGLGWSGVKGRSRSIAGGEEGCQGLVKETAAARRTDFRLWHRLLLKAEASRSPIDRSHTEPLPRRPGRPQQPRSGQGTENVMKAVQAPEGQVWHLWGRAEN